MAKVIATLAVVCFLALAGCSDKGDGGSGSPTSSSSGTSTGPGGNGTTIGNGTLEPIILTGTVTGIQDCALEASGQNALSPANVVIPAAASNRSYTLTFSGGQSPPAGFAGCIGFAGGPITGGASGTIPSGAVAAQVAVNNGQGRTYTLTIV